MSRPAPSRRRSPEKASDCWSDCWPHTKDERGFSDEPARTPRQSSASPSPGRSPTDTKPRPSPPRPWKHPARTRQPPPPLEPPPPPPPAASASPQHTAAAVHLVNHFHINRASPIAPITLNAPPF